MSHVDPVKRAQYMREYRAKNYNRIRARDRITEAAWREKHHAERLEYEAQYRENNREKLRKKWREWAQASRYHEPKKNRARALKRLYGLTQEQYDHLLAAQGGHCAVCDRTPEQQNKGVLHVDHNHVTGDVRGLLCHHHNTALGLCRDNSEELQALVRYLAQANIHELNHADDCSCIDS